MNEALQSPTANGSALVALAPTGAHVEHYQQVVLDREKLTLLKKTLAADANLTDAELELFGTVCERKGLDPFAGQIHVSKRSGKLIFQTGIDGFRLIAQRSGLYAGQDAPEWCGIDGVWKQVWPKSFGDPVAARIRVYRRDWLRPVEVIAHWDEYVQRKGDGSVNSMWKQRGPAQLAKCAESLALRKAFPHDYSGLYTDEEMAQADNVIDVNSSPARTYIERSLASDNGPASADEPTASAPVRDVVTEPVHDVTDAVKRLTESAKAELRKWWKDNLPRRVTPGSVPEHFIAKVDAQLTVLGAYDGGPDGDPNSAPVPEGSGDDIADAEVVDEDGQGQNDTSVTPPKDPAGSGPGAKALPPLPNPPAAAGGAHGGHDILQAVCREMGISPPDRNRYATKFFERQIRRPGDLSDEEARQLADFFEDGTFVTARRVETDAAASLGDAFGDVEDVTGEELAS